MNRQILDYLQHHQGQDIGEAMFRVIDGVQKEEDVRKRVAAVALTNLMILDATVGVQAGMDAAFRAFKHMQTQEADHFKAIRDYIEHEINKGAVT